MSIDYGKFANSLNAIVVWRFQDAPADLKLLSPHGGEEDDWIAVVPVNLIKPVWMEAGGAFGCCDVSEHHLGNGAAAYIGVHS